MQNAKMLSIVSITYNNAEGLARTLSSICSQDMSTCSLIVQIIVIDGGSRDGTQQVVEMFEEVSVFISQADRGVYDAMNKGISLADGEYQLFLNAGDVFYGAGALEAIGDAMESDAAWIVGRAFSLDGGRSLREIDNVPHRWFYHAYGLQVHCHQSCIFSSSLVKALNGYSEEYEFIGDFDFILRAGLISEPAYIDDFIVVYEGGGLSSVNGGRIPDLQHKVRLDRLKLSRGAAIVDRAFVRYQLLRRHIQPFVGGIKTKAVAYKRLSRT